jgi:hypothetical protein
MWDMGKHECQIIIRHAHKVLKRGSSFVMPVCLSAWNNSPPTGWVFMKFDILIFFENVFGKFKFD